MNQKPLTLPPDWQARPDLLADRVILVTGAGDGIGRAAAKTFARHGATVILLGKTTGKLEQVYDEIMDAGHPEPMMLTLDLQYLDPDSANELAEQIQQSFGRLDGLLHNAALLGSLTTVQDYSPERWQQVMQVNFHASYLLTRALLPLMRDAPDASILFTSSSVGRRGRAFWGAYAVSKSAVECLAQVLADELVTVTPVRVNTVNPGGTRTRMRAAAYPGENPDTRPTADSLMPLWLYLMGPDSIGISGETFDAQSA